MNLERETAAPVAAGNGGKGIIAPAIYRSASHSATDFASLLIAERFRLPLHLARTVCELASIGGRAA